MHKVLIHQASYDHCREAVDRAFDLFPMPVKGRSVLIKPNALRASNAEQGIVTHPAVVRAVVEKVEALGAGRIVVGDNPGMMSYGANEKTFRQSGLMEAAKGHYENIGSDAVEVDFNPKFADRVSVSRAVMDADVLISVPKFKTHGLTIVTGAVKNSYGLLPGAIKANLHNKSGTALRFHEMLIDVFKLRVPDLVIMDAVVGMEGNGPASTELRDIGRILASDNAVALDAVMSRMMGFDPADLPFLQTARARGLGTHEDREIEIVGTLAPLPNFKLPPSAGASWERSTGGDFFMHRTGLRPKADPALCTACGVCIDQCPASALSMGEDLPEVNAEVCLACFCCQEMCPEAAMKLS